MRWIVLNGLGAIAWLAGLLYAKGIDGGTDYSFDPSDHHLLVGASVGLAGLALLVWENVRSTG